MRHINIRHIIAAAFFSLFALVFAQESGGMSVMQCEGPPLEPATLTRLYQETFDDGRPTGEMFGGALVFGQDDVWTGSLSEGRYELTNSADSGAVTYFYLLEPAGVEGPPSQGAASVEVGGTFGELPGVGLLYRFDPETDFFYAFGLTGTGTYAFYKRDAEGFNRVIEASSGAIQAAGPNRLTIVSEGPEMKLYINETFVASVSDSAIPQGGVGILVAGTGTFTFDNFTIYAVGQETTTEDVTGGGMSGGTNSGVTGGAEGGMSGGASSGGANPLVPDLSVKNCDNPLVPCDPFVGTFTDGRLTLILDAGQGAGGGYAGQVTLDGESYPLEAQGEAQESSETLNGTFTAGDNRFEFSATLEGDTLTFVTGSTTYTLSRVGEAGGGDKRTSTSAGVPAPQPPQESLTLSYVTYDYSQATPEERGDASAVSFEIEPVENGLYHVKYFEDGALDDEGTVDAEGYALEEGERSNDNLPLWNPGRTDFFDAAWTVTREGEGEGDRWVYRAQEDDFTLEVFYDAASGHLTHYLACEENGDCFELQPAPAPDGAPASQ